MEQKFLIGVYDHLRREGESHLTYMPEATYLGTYYTEPEYDLYALAAAYPGLSRDGSTSILLEIFEIDETTLKNADYYEGFNPFSPNIGMFKRIKIDTPFGDCWVYEYNRPIIGKPRIETGDWFQYKKEIRTKVQTLNEQSRWGE